MAQGRLRAECLQLRMLLGLPPESVVPPATATAEVRAAAATTTPVPSNVSFTLRVVVVV